MSSFISRRTLSSLLVVALSLSATSAASVTLPPKVPDPLALSPADCKPSDECLCLAGDDVDNVNRALIDYESMEGRVAVYKQMAEDLKVSAKVCDAQTWWQTPGVVIGGVVVSLSFGALLGWLAARR